MTTFQLAMRLCENLQVPDWSRLPLPEAERLREALQTGLSAFAQLLPSQRQQQPLTEPLQAPVTQPIDAISGAKTFAYVAGGSAYPLGGYASETLALGRMAVMSDVALLNRLVLPGTLQTPHLGATGTVDMTLYGDSVSMGHRVWQVLNNPRFISTACRQTLLPAPETWDRPYQLELGTPRYWWTESLAGADQSAVPVWILRVWPVPAAVGYLELLVSAFPTAISFLDLHDEPRALPVHADEEPWLISLCEEALLKSPLWREDISKTDVRHAAEAARQALRLRQTPMSNTPKRIGTPRGW